MGSGHVSWNARNNKSCEPAQSNPGSSSGDIGGESMSKSTLLVHPSFASRRGILQMGLLADHEQPVLALMYRTMHNLEFIEAHKRDDGPIEFIEARKSGDDRPFEVTQLINSFLAIVAHPWDQLLDKGKLKANVQSEIVLDCRFPTVPALPLPEQLKKAKPAQAESIGGLLRVIRNGVAHGNIELIDRHMLGELRDTYPLQRVGENDIAGIKVWNRCEGETNWITALSVSELRQFIYATLRLCENRNLWREDVRSMQGIRERVRA